MYKAKYIFTYIIFIVGFSISLSQDNQRITMSQDDFFEIVRKHHPVARQAELRLKSGEADVLRAKGGFDPEVFAYLRQKYFDDERYYSMGETGLVIPTEIGVDIVGGFTNNLGNYVNPEFSNPAVGLWFGGLSIPIGRGLFIDRRRAELKKARIFRDITETEYNLLLNDLLYEAGTVYWDWAYSYNIAQIYEEGFKLANERLDAVKRDAELGDRPFIDTLETAIFLQNISVSRMEARVNYINKSIELSTYLWSEGIVPLELDENIIPSEFDQEISLDINTLKENINSLIENHPKISQIQFKRDGFEVERDLNLEFLKPNLNIKYNALNQANTMNPIENYNNNNYTWALEFNMPLFLRESRGNLELSELKIQETELELNRTKVELNYLVNSSINEWENSNDMIEVFTKTVNDYRTLLEAEQRLFRGGESSIFMVNSREINLINSQIKLVDLLTKNKFLILKSYYSLGLLN